MNSENRAWRVASRLHFIVALLAVVGSTANADSFRVGQIKTVAGQAEIVRSGTRIAARVGDLLYEKDTIETGPDGSIGITFFDNTVMSSAPDSQLPLAHFKSNSSNFQLS